MCAKKYSEKEHLHNGQGYEKSDKEHSSEYFSLIQLKLRRFYDENQHNPLNIAISLDKKDFNTLVTTNRIPINSHKYIYWKSYLTKYLEKEANNGVLWVIDLLHLIKSELFLSENKWLSMFFWQEFEIRTKPKCLRSFEAKKWMNNEKQINDDARVTDKFTGSFVSVSSESVSVNDPSHEYKLYRNRVKAYISIFCEHIFDIDHPINIVAKMFEKIFTNVIKEKLEELKVLKEKSDPSFESQSIKISEELTKQLQKFILKLQTSLRLMYSRTINYRCFIEEKDEFINLVTSLIFKEGGIYKSMYDLFHIVLSDECTLLEKQLGELKGIRPNDLGIHMKFCLNESTVEFQKNLLEQKESYFGLISDEEKADMIKHDIMSQIGKKKVLPDSVSESSWMISSREENNNSENAINKITSPKREFRIYSESGKVLISAKKKTKPTEKSPKKPHGSYHSAIKLLRSIKKYRVPFDKIMLIASISAEITECVNTFWTDMENIITSTLLNINADELMTLFIYIIIKAQMPDLLIHLKFIQEFTTSTTRTAMIGYYYTTMEASLIYIQTIQDKKDLVDRNKMKAALSMDRSRKTTDNEGIILK